MQMKDVTLDDKYTLDRGHVFVTGSQALARLPMLQRNRDAAAGLNTAGYISGYRGSPLGGYDMALWSARKHLDKAQIRFQPGLNEDLAATAIWGTQQVGIGGRSDYDGVFSIWYGKGPGVDRSGDVFKHANLAGTSARGGVLVLFGDDPMAKSSTVAHQSEPALIAASIPVFNPASIQEYIDYGLMAFALSRYAGVWVGMKCITDIVEGSASIDIDPDRVTVAIPEDLELPADGVHIRQPDWALDQERRLVRVRMPAVLAFLRANRLDKVTHDVSRRRLGIVASGKSWADLMGAFDQLGIDDAAREAMGISVYKPAVVWPLEPEGVRAFAKGQDELLVIEEKRGLLEEQIARILYGETARPPIFGKYDEKGDRLFAEDGELSVRDIARILADRLRRFAPDHTTLERLEAGLAIIPALPGGLAAPPRQPWFCAGCPHNTSTRVPDGSRAFAGIGCHTMALLMPNRKTETFTQMGGEGAQWIGQAPFSKDKHVFQNLGDGTYCHSGFLAIRAAIAAGVNITYKILFNDAVAMTGGQAFDKPQTPWGITRQVVAEGVKQVIVVSDEPDRYPAGTPWAEGVTIRDRSELDLVQRELREVQGTTVLLYDQTCAAEKRRRRKRGTFPNPPKRAFINSAVCEGCGDCGVKSNCVAIKPLETAFGRKREIDQSSCNKDFSCINGFCPSFVTIHGAEPKKPAKANLSQASGLAAMLGELPEPRPAAIDGVYNILVTGIGGTGVVTIGALLGMGAHLSGLGVSVLDQTGLAQKNGAVTSHVRVGARPDLLYGTRIPAASTDLVIGCDMIVAAGQDALGLYRNGRTHCVVNDHVTPLASFAIAPDQSQDASPMIEAVRRVVGQEAADFVAAGELAERLTGDAIFTNPFLLGFACQKGLIPLGRDVLEEAIRLNGVAINANLDAFGWGRIAAHSPERIAEILAPKTEVRALPASFEEIVAHRMAHLTDYQNAAYAERYRKLVEAIAAAESRVAPASRSLAIAVAKNYAKLLAYKDEYEVARLYSLPAFRDSIAAGFETPKRLTVYLAPPILARPDPVTGVSRKREFGPWIFTAFSLLARFKGLRGTTFDIFGRSADRKLERQLI
ncbi:MAG: hypothetical protein RLZZ444_1048, partial [Pseudomonadota bacterium]